MAELNSKTVYKVLDDNSFISEIRTLLIELGDEELSKPDSEINFDFIEECTNALLMLDEEKDNKAAVIIPFVTGDEFISRFANKKNRYKKVNSFFKIAAVAALIAAGTITVNAAVANTTGYNFLKEAGNRIQSVIEYFTSDKTDEDTQEAEPYEPPMQYAVGNDNGEETEKQAEEPAERTETNKKSDRAYTYYKPNIDDISDEDGPDDGGDNPSENNNSGNSNQNNQNNQGGDNSGNNSSDNEGADAQNENEKDYAADTVPVIDDKTEQKVYKGLRVNLDSFKRNYIYGEEIDYESIKLKKLYSDGSTEPLSISDTRYTTGIDMNKTQNVTIKIVYQKTTATVDITVRPDEETRKSEICENDDFTYLLTDKGAYITSYTGDSKNLDIASLDGNKVYAVSNGVFKNSNIKAVNAPNVEKVFAGAFEDCNYLTDITLSGNISYLGEKAFKNTGLTELTLSGSYTEIPQSLFEGCKSLEEVTISPNVTKIKKSAFEDCESLTELNGTENITEVEGYAFSNDEKVEFAFPKRLKSAGDGAFYNCKALSVGDIDETLESVGREAFAYCYGVTKITLNDKITSVPEGAFKGTGAKSVTVPEGVTSIGDYAFNGIKAKSLTLPESIKTLGTYSVNSLYLTEITFGSKIEKMGENAVYGGRRVKLYVYENSVPYQYAEDNGIKYELI